MKINYCSDLHLNQMPKADVVKVLNSLQESADVLIIAGDFLSKKTVNYSAGEYTEQMIKDHDWLLETTMKSLKNFEKPIFWIPGNHEFHGMKIGDLQLEYQSIIPSNVEFLHNKIFYIENQKIVGSTMWYEPTEYKGSSSYHIHDFAVDFAAESQRCLDFLQKEVSSDSLVITHMLPSMKSVHEAWRNAKSNVVFVREMDELILERQPKYWIYGHSHNPVPDYCIGNTQILTNPRGSNKEIKQNQCWKMKNLII